MSNIVKVDLSKQIIPKHQALFVDSKSNREIEDWFLTSGRSGSKSSAVSIYGSTEASEKLTAVVYMRKNHNKLKQTVFAESKRSIHRIGLSIGKHTKTTQTPMKITFKHNGSSIYFTGSDNPDDTKGMIDENASISLVVIDELTEFFKMGYERGKEEIENIKATFLRGNNGQFRFIYLFNPPQNPNDPVMKFMEEKLYYHDKKGKRIEKNHKARRIHTTYLDVPVEWQGQRLLDSAEDMKKRDEEYYRWLWLGESVGVKGLIYYMFDKDRHVVDYEGQHLTQVGIGVDYGHLNATTFNAYGIDRTKKRVQGILGYRHSGRETRQPKTVREYAEDFKAFVQEVEKKIDRKVEFYTIDPSATAFKIELRKLLPNLRAVDAQNTVATGISRVQTLKRYDALVYDSQQKGAIEENGLYSWDEKKLDRGIEEPIKDHDHDMDGERYYIMAIYTKYLLNLLPELKEVEKESE